MLSVTQKVFHILFLPELSSFSVIIFSGSGSGTTLSDPERLYRIRNVCDGSENYSEPVNKHSCILDMAFTIGFRQTSSSLQCLICESYSINARIDLLIPKLQNL